MFRNSNGVKMQFLKKHKELIFALLEDENPGNVNVLQVGANNGVMADPINASVKKYCWSGDFFEPHPEYFRRLVENYAEYPKVKTHNIAVSNKPGNLDIFCLDVKFEKQYPSWLRGCASSDRERFKDRVEACKVGKDPESVIKQITVPCTRLDEFGLPDKVDLAVIDVEGFELKVLDSFIPDSMSTKLFIIETNHDSQTTKQIKECMAKFGYLHHHVRDDTFFFEPTFAERVSKMFESFEKVGH